MHQRSRFAPVVVVCLVVLAGCTGSTGTPASPSSPSPATEAASGTPTPTASDAPHVRIRGATVVENVPAVVINYSLTDYATALLVGPDGEVISEEQLEPDDRQAALALTQPRPGEYEVVVQQGGETIASATQAFDGAKPVLKAAQRDWKGNSLQRVRVMVTNRGDLPMRLQSISVTLAGDAVEQDLGYTWVAPGATGSETVTAEYTDLSVAQPGGVKGVVRVNTTRTTVTETFSRTFSGANLTVESVTPVWTDNELARVRVTVRNTGDLPTTVEASVSSSSRQLAASAPTTLASGEATTLTVETYGTIYTVDSGGRVALDLVVNGSDSFVERTITKRFTGGNLSLGTVQTRYEDGKLTAVSVAVTNTGDVAADATVQFSVNGREIQTVVRNVAPGETTEVAIETDQYSPFYTVTDAQTVTVTATASAAGQTATSRSEREFGGPQGRIFNVDPSFIGDADSSNVEFLSLSFDIQNTGNISFAYSAIEIEIAGVTQTNSVIQTTLQPGESQREYFNLPYGFTVPSGQQELTIRLLTDDGEVVFSRTITINATA